MRMILTIACLSLFTKNKMNSFIWKNNKKTNTLYSFIVLPCPKEEIPAFLSKIKPKVCSKSIRKPPLCSNCKHFIPFKTYLSFDNDEYGSGFGLCKMFGSKYDLIRYSFAKYCRENENQCGREGFLYEDMNSHFDSKKYTMEKEKENENEKEKEKEKLNNSNEESLSEKENKENEIINHYKSEVEDLKYTNLELYDYSIFLSSRKRNKK